MVDDQLTVNSPRSPRPRWWSLVRKILVLVIGIPIVLAGLVMMVTPGPGIPVLIGGLAILAIEFAWAERHVTRMRNAASKVFRRNSDDRSTAPGE